MADGWWVGWSVYHINGKPDKHPPFEDQGIFAHHKLLSPSPDHSCVISLLFTVAGRYLPIKPQPPFQCSLALSKWWRYENILLKQPSFFVVNCHNLCTAFWWNWDVFSFPPKKMKSRLGGGSQNSNSLITHICLGYIPPKTGFVVAPKKLQKKSFFTLLVGIW
jgi:hypothetical protein